MTTTELEDSEPSCPRCGSSASWEECSEFGCDDGVIDRYEEDPLWYGFAQDSERYETCHMCRGTGGWWRCLSSYDWCQANPLPGQEQTRRAA